MPSSRSESSRRRNGSNLYAYVANDPINRTDPTGTTFLGEIGAAQTMQYALQGARAAAIGAASSAAFNIGTQLLMSGTIEWDEVGKDAALGGALGAAGTALKYVRFVRKLKEARNLSVIGSGGEFGQYEQVAERLGANRFKIPPDIWRSMSEVERRAANTRFLERAVARGEDFFLSTPLSKVFPKGNFEFEIGYLLERGYQLAADGMMLLH